MERCPVCSGDPVRKKAEKLVPGGQHTAVTHAEALVCRRCGQRLYDEPTVRRFEEIRDKLERQETGEFQELGRSFEVA